MMKKMMFLAAILVLISGPAMADSLQVTNAAALGGTAQNDCAVVLNPDGTDATPVDNEPGPCGLEVLHDNTSAVWVQDDTPNNETIYRFEFLYNPNFIGPTGDSPVTGGGWRFSLFAALAANPRPNNPANPCPLNPNIPVFPVRVFAIFGGPNQTIPGLRLTAMTNQCGILGTPGIFFTDGTTKKACGYVEIATSGPGEAGFTLVDPADSCPPQGDPSYGVVFPPNQQIPVIGARLGNIAINPFQAGENGSFYVDEFASFRTLAP